MNGFIRNFKPLTILSEEQIDPNRWMDSRTPLQKVALYLAAAADGMMESSGQGGGGSILNLIMANINQDINAQKA